LAIADFPLSTRFFADVRRSQDLMKRGKDGTAAVKKATVAPKAGDSKRFGNIKFKEPSGEPGDEPSGRDSMGFLGAKEIGPLG